MKSETKSTNINLLKTAVAIGSLLIIGGFVSYWIFNFFAGIIFVNMIMKYKDPDTFRTPAPIETVCQNPDYSIIRLGRVYAGRYPQHTFKTQGGELIIYGKNITNSSFLGDIYKGWIYIELFDHLDQATFSGQESSYLSKLEISNNSNQKITLPPGTYNLSTSVGIDVEIVSCSPNNVSL